MSKSKIYTVKLLWKDRVTQAQANDGKFSVRDKNESFYLCSDYIGEKLGIEHVPKYSYEDMTSMAEEGVLDSGDFHNINSEQEAVMNKLGIEQYYKVQELMGTFDFAVEVDDIDAVQIIMEDVDLMIAGKGGILTLDDLEEMNKTFATKRKPVS